MTMSFADSYNESTRMRSTRPSRPTYVSPHLRNAPSNGDVSFTVTVPEKPDRSWFYTEPSDRFNRYSRGGPSRGRGRGIGRGRGRLWSPAVEFNHVSKPSPFDDLEKFDELEIPEDGKINFDAYEDIPVESSGLDIPPPAKSFDEIDLGKALSDNLNRCKYVKPTPIQRHAIPVAMAGRDLMACAQTGSGKTAAFCFPIISRISKEHLIRPVSSRALTLACPLALILSPTRELCCQIHEEAKKFSYQSGVKVAVAYGGAPISLQLRNLERGVDILVATPGRLVDMIERGRVSLKKIKYLALDEADRMLDMGFEPQIRKIVEQMEMPPPGARQTMLFSATFPTEIQALAADFLSDYIFLAVGRVGSSTDLIVQKVDLVQDMDKRNHLMDLLYAQQENGTYGKHALVLVFVETKRGADALENFLTMNGFPATAIHGDKVQMERERALRSFKTGRTPILVATDVASRGLDIPHVAHVINFDLPKGIDDYVHRIGRTGRAGKSGLATAFFSDKNHYIAKALLELMQEAKQDVPPWLSQYAETSSPYGGGGGRTNRYEGGNKFGGRDFRSGGNYHYSGQYADSLAVADPYTSTSNNALTEGAHPSYDFSAYTQANYYPAGSQGNEFDDGWN